VTARILNVSPDAYHELPHFSSSTAKVLLAKSALHAKAGVGKKPTKLMDRGAVVHRLVLGKGADYEVVNAKDFKTNKAKEDRDKIRAAGKVPVLVDDLEDYHTVAERIRVQLADRNIVLDGQSELAIEWTEHTSYGDVTCKGMLDHCWLDAGLILDLKITEDAAPSSVERTSENLGYAVQCAAYTRALAALDPNLAGRIGFAFAFCEPNEPYAINVSEPDGIFQHLGEQRWLRAVTTWAKCQHDGIWPGYGTSINPLSSPSWALAREGFSTDDR